MTAGPSRTSELSATGMASPSVRAQGESAPKMPLAVLAVRVPRSFVKSKLPFSSPAAPAWPRFTAFTVEGRTEPLAKGRSWAVSVSVTP